MNRTGCCLTLGIVFAAACGGGAASPDRGRGAGRAEVPFGPRASVSAEASADAAPSGPSGPAHEGEPFYLRAMALPARYAHDGEIGEWNLTPKRNAVVLGVRKDKLVVAVTWVSPKRPPVALAIGAIAPSLPAIGWQQRGGSTHELTEETCAVEQIPLIEAGWADGRKNPPEVAKACRELLARYQKTSAEIRGRFVRRLRVGPEGAASLDVKGDATPIAEAKVVAKEHSVEIELPLSFLPAQVTAPVKELWVVAEPGQLPEIALQPMAESPDPSWRRLELDKPVGFGAHDDVLAALLADGPFDGPMSLTRVWYEPGSADTLRVITTPDVPVKAGPAPKMQNAIGGPSRPDRPALAQSEEAVLREIDTLGDVTVGVAGFSHGIATLKKGKLVKLSSCDQPLATQRRGDQLHLYAYREGGFSWMAGFQHPSWSVCGVKPDGSVEELADESPDMPGVQVMWDGTPARFNGADWTTFGLKGKRDGKPKTITWTWDDKAKRYGVAVAPPNASDMP